ncbi:hypothetical protein T261_00005 [Streptomyces lydicus]|nr:hypothetical protein T261_00005 [Streptomyces lydicus]
MRRGALDHGGLPPAADHSGYGPHLAAAFPRTWPGWPVRAGTTTLFAALEVATGKVIGSLHRRHRAGEFKKFLAKLDKEVPADLEVHLILDNYVTHKTPAVKQWLLAHPRFPRTSCPPARPG